jgi:hypothetical protein
MSVADLNPEERAALVARAQQARRDKTEAYKSKAHLLRQGFADRRHWQRLASQFKVRMPPEYIPCSELRFARRAIRKTGLDYVAWFDEALREFPKNNPTWPAYALIGIILEAAAEIAHVELPDDDDFDLDALIGAPVDLGDDELDELETECDEVDELI